jgi:hypothetical protein
MSPISNDFLFDCVNKFTGLGPRNFSMYTDSDRSHIGCNVSSQLGPVSLVVLFRQHREGEEGFLIYLCHLEVKRCTNLIVVLTSLNAGLGCYTKWSP